MALKIDYIVEQTGLVIPDAYIKILNVDINSGIANVAVFVSQQLRQEGKMPEKVFQFDVNGSLDSVQNDTETPRNIIKKATYASLKGKIIDGVDYTQAVDLLD